MATQSDPPAQAGPAPQASWVPMLIIALAQIQMAFNVNALPVSIGGIVDTFDTSPTMVGTALVVYSLAVAGFVMLGAKLGKLFGSRLMFQITALIHGLSMGLMAVSPSAMLMLVAQAVAGLAAAVLVPTLVVLIATHYRGGQQAQALGLLGASQAAAGMLAFLVAGVLGTLVGWRVSFGLLVIVAIVVFALSFRLLPVDRYPGVQIDWIGAVLVAAAMMLISLGVNFLNDWGLLLAKPGAPFTILGVSPAPLMIVVGITLAQAFLVWCHRRGERGRTPLLALAVLDSPQERAAIFCMFIIGALGPANNFLIPLYIQIVQGRTSLETAIAVVPYTLAIFAGTALIVRLFDRVTSRQIGRVAFIFVAVGLVLLAFTVQNDWGTPLVILGLIIVGLAEGALLTLVFSVLVSASPKELAGDVGALRGTTNNLSTAIGTAFASVFAVGVLSSLILANLIDNPTIPPSLKSQVALDRIDFVSNDQLLEVLSKTTATPEQVTEAVRINTDSRLRALRIAFLVLAAISLLAVVPAGGLPHYDPAEVTIDEEASRAAPVGAAPAVSD